MHFHKYVLDNFYLCQLCGFGEPTLLVCISNNIYRGLDKNIGTPGKIREGDNRYAIAWFIGGAVVYAQGNYYYTYYTTYFTHHL